MAMTETAPALMCLDAKASIFGPNGERCVPVEAFYVSSGIVYLEENEILKGIEVPNPPAQTSGIYLRHSMRGHLGFALVGVATVLTISKGLCRNARIALLGVARKPMRAYKTEELLTGERIKPNLIDEAASLASKECHPLGDIFGSAGFRRELVKVLVKRAIRDISERTLKNALTVKAP
jgi:carbon-monoxide dehydrogenase medium subunit